MTAVPQKLQLTINQTEKLIVEDGNNQGDKEKLLKLINEALNKKEYIDSIKSTLESILADKKLDISDLSKMMILSIQVNKLLPELVSLLTSLVVSKVKYIVFASIFYYISEYQSDFFEKAGMTIDVFRVLFSSLWNLVEVDPQDVKIKSKKLCLLCCGGEEVKSNEPVK
jgi:hypothetical protein